MEQKTPENQGSIAREVVGIKAATVILFIVFTLGVVGYLVGIRHVTYTRETTHPVLEAMEASKQEAQLQQVKPAVTYKQISQGNLGPNASWKTQVPESNLQSSNIMPRVDYAYGGDKAAAIARREARRAFNGAPPTIPHQIDNVSTQSCIACHGLNGQSLRIGNEVAAPALPHPYLTNCTQCHVPQNDILPEEQHWLENSFVGESTPMQGDRAYPGAPPTMPHSLWMRETCLSCHGPNGQSALRSGHVWRANCLQCHGQSASLNQFGGDNQFITPNFKLPAQHE